MHMGFSTKKNNALNFTDLHLQQRATFTIDKSNRITEYIHRNINIHSTIATNGLQLMLLDDKEMNFSLQTHG